METVHSLASAASKAIWGDGKDANETQTGVNGNETAGTEPVSGQTGNVDAGEPYDKGNAGENPRLKEPSNPANLSFSEPELASKVDIENNETPNTSTLPSNPKPAESERLADDKPTSSTETPADPSSAPQDTTKQQGADRPAEEPGNTESDRIKETKKEAEDAAGVDVSGPGPRALEEKAKEGGAAGAGAGDEEEDGPQKESHGEGTGEKWVKSSGMKADGGDFDASNPGAGREADRLLDDKGIHRAEAPAAKEGSGSSTPDSKEKKPSLKEKIKAKLHRNKE